MLPGLHDRRAACLGQWSRVLKGPGVVRRAGTRWRTSFAATYTSREVKRRPHHFMIHLVMLRICRRGSASSGASSFPVHRRSSTILYAESPFRLAFMSKAHTVRLKLSLMYCICTTGMTPTALGNALCLPRTSTSDTIPVIEEPRPDFPPKWAKVPSNGRANVFLSFFSKQRSRRVVSRYSI